MKGLEAVALTHFWADKENLAIKADYSTVVVYVAVGDGKTDIQEYAMAGFIFKNSSQHLHTMEVKIGLKKMVIARIT
jgi:hypothetical protein